MDRHCRLEFAADGTGALRRIGKSPGTLRGAFSRGRDQFFVPPLSSRGDVARWRDSIPSGFLFSVKMPKTITHELRLEGAGEQLTVFLNEIATLGDRVGCLLVQPPSLAFDDRVAAQFFADSRGTVSVAVACEPRHESWFADDADQLLAECKIARVATDPSRVPAAASPGGWRGMSYYRLHGSPQIYRSSYDEAFIATLARRIEDDRAADRDVWAIFDNTTLGAATRNALELSQVLASHEAAKTR